jgi:hypothetical protein
MTSNPLSVSPAKADLRAEGPSTIALAAVEARDEENSTLKSSFDPVTPVLFPATAGTTTEALRTGPFAPYGKQIPNSIPQWPPQQRCSSSVPPKNSGFHALSRSFTVIL